MSETDRSAPQPQHLHPPRGMRDLAPPMAQRVMDLEQVWSRQAASYGFVPVRPAPVGFESTFTVGHTAARNRLYEFPDKRGRRLALCGDSLAAVLRVHEGMQAARSRLHFACPVFRYERGPSRHWTHLGVAEIGPAPVGDAALVRLAEVGAGFLIGRYPVELVVGDVGIWRALLQEVLPDAPADDVLFELRKLPAEAWSDHFRGRGVDGHVVVRLHRLLEPSQAAPDGIGIAAVDRRIDHLAELTRRLASVTGVSTRADPTDLHGSEFTDGPMFRWRDPESGRNVGDGGDFSRYGSRFLGRPVGVASSVVGLEMVARRTLVDPGVAAIAVVGAEDDRSMLHARELVVALRAGGARVWDVDEPAGLRALVAVAREHDLGVVAHARTDEQARPTVRVGDGVTSEILAPDRALAWVVRALGTAPPG